MPFIKVNFVANTVCECSKSNIVVCVYKANEDLVANMGVQKM